MCIRDMFSPPNTCFLFELLPQEILQQNIDHSLRYKTRMKLSIEVKQLKSPGTTFQQLGFSKCLQCAYVALGCKQSDVFCRNSSMHVVQSVFTSVVIEQILGVLSLEAPRWVRQSVTEQILIGYRGCVLVIVHTLRYPQRYKIIKF